MEEMVEEMVAGVEEDRHRRLETMRACYRRASRRQRAVEEDE